VSLFDVIKYPISSRPTADDILHLPTPIYQKWWSLIEHEDSPILTPESLALLRRLILEYEE
jgi:hypothetical protein